MATAQDLIVVRSRRTENAARTLICLGFCGGGTGQYHQWGSVLPPDVDLAAICYPGREGRFMEDFAQTWDALADDATQAVLSAAAEGPYVLLGHSMGGWMAFDVTVRIERLGGPAPEALVVSSANAASRGLTVKDMFPAQEDNDEQLLGWMTMHGMMPEHVVNDPDLKELAVELMRADIRVRDTFHYVPGSKVSVPLQVLTGETDTVIEPNAGEQWRDLATGDFRHDVLPGGHFYTPEVWSRIPTYIPALSGAFNSR
ncbi:alpha/beta fold hydrolase [Kitasatospora sp. RB6PN24]|uniref:thioesterase II family protein n=1 Tax=Kitasatospora humi TaxID=2893891 RepID=UPI001E442E19|nr:alpha/beta fold hydrolase [Kitasatospora humi]MCC9312189.1 alpha/beta fold hydrolase [Kitasatospora humi]